MKKVIVFGTFDFLHSGHLRFLQQAKRRGEHLTVVVGRDETVYRVKNARPIHNEKERLELVRHIDLVDEAILGGKKDMYAVIKKIRPHVVGLGYDQSAFVGGLEDFIKKNRLHIKIVRLKAYKPFDRKSAFFKVRLKLNI